MSGSLEDLIKIDSVLKERIPTVLGPSYPKSDKIVKILQENDIISPKVWGREEDRTLGYWIIGWRHWVLAFILQLS